MAKRKNPPYTAKQQPDSGKESDKSRLIIQFGALALVIALVVYLLVEGFANDGVGSSTAASDTANDGASGPIAGGQPAGVEELPIAPITIDPPFIHFGDVPPNTSHTQQVTLTNTGSSPVRVTDARPTCPCTKVERRASSINPGRSITLEIEMDSESRIGPKNVGVSVMFAGYEPMRIPISATVVDDPA